MPCPERDRFAMGIRRHIVRNGYGPELVELFLIGSVVSVLAIRAFLASTGYPQLGGDGLHIAHMLWGGVFMTVALLLLFGLLGPAVQRWSAVLAGIGFGTFIDELGKFITSDNNYFYEPTIGLIYIIFIGLFLLLRALRQTRQLSPEEALANVLNRLEGAVEGRMGASARQELLLLLEEADSANPMTVSLRRYIREVDVLESSGSNPYLVLRDGFLRHYRRIAASLWFGRAVIAFFVFQTAVQLVLGAFLLGGFRVLAPQGLTFAEGAQLAASAVAGLLILWGLVLIRRSRLRAYPWLLRGVLVNIFVTQVFVFLEYQLAGLSGLFWNILLYLALRFMQEGENPAHQDDCKVLTGQVQQR